MPYLESVTTYRPLPETPFRFNIKQESHWLTDYEKRPDSIFRYYSLENEIDFLQKAEELPLSKRQYYVQENVKRFLGEFVGKIPYTTIPYEIDREGFSYAGLHVMDSYRKAADLGGTRERAETGGFEQIEERFKQTDGDASAFWISPPKIADYGFVFVLEKDKTGLVKEYILRYPEKKGQLEKSNVLFSQINPNEPLPVNTDDFLLHPIYGKSENGRENVEAVMRIIGIDEQKIHASGMFEQLVESNLGIWIQRYSEIMCSLAYMAPHSFLYEQGVIEGKKILLTIYQKAEEIKSREYAPLSSSTRESLPSEQLDQHMLYDRIMALPHDMSLLPTATSGSCPSVPNKNQTENNFISSSEMFQSLTQGLSPERLIQNMGNKKEGSLDCTCPHCKQKVRAIIANGTITCPRKECGKSAPYAC